jgi:hypothetical protein
MIRSIVCVLLLAGMVSTAAGQIRHNILVVEAGKVFELSASDILVADTLIMKDSSTIKLNHLKDDNFIHCKKLVVGNSCTIIGRGENGRVAKSGGNGSSIVGPCHDGTNGRNGARGGDGIKGNNLFLYADHITFLGDLSIDLAGGNAADGGSGGNGGGGSGGTKLCPGGNGGNGGNGAPGGNGGNAGNLTIRCKFPPNLRSELGRKLKVRVYGGLGGVGGEGGSPGLPGSVVNGTSQHDGKVGLSGKGGASGMAGKDGIINFE